MKLALTILTFLTLICGSTSAQTTANVERTDDTRTTFPVRVYLTVGPDGTIYPARATADKVIIAVGAFVIQNGNPGYLLETDSIRFEGDDDVINRLSTGRIYEFLSAEVVYEGTRLGLTPSSYDCSAPVQTKVYAASCVTRTWRGSLSTITPCTADQFSIWEYAVCSNPQDNSLKVTRVPYYNMSICGGGIGMECEPSCPSTPDGFQIQ